MKNKFKPFLSICRPEQYYKNLIIFAAIFFGGKIIQADSLFAVFLGFLSLCLMSSVNYIINDISDLKKDKFNKEKSNRPLAAGEISIRQSLALAVILFALSIIISYYLERLFFFLVILLFFFSSVYSMFLRNEMFADIIVISVNFIIRAISGGVIGNVWISPWLIIGTFFLALFLAAAKRKSEFSFLKEYAGKHRKVLELYSEEMLNSLMAITTTCLLLSYVLYSLLSINQNIAFSLPIVLYIILRYLFLAYSGSEIARMPHKIFSDRKIFIAIIFYISIAFLALYS